MRWQTETQIPPFNFTITHKSNLLLLGSCFAENMGARLENAKFKVVQNPTGIVYNPLSLQQTVELICSDKLFTASDLEFVNDLYFSYTHHSRFSAANADAAVQNIHAALAAARKNLSKTDVVFISLGTAFYWWHKAKNEVVNNCHKQPSNFFEQRLATVNQVKSALKNTVDLLKNANPNVEIVFTVSPIRHLKHGSAGNQLSKSTLIVAAQELVASENNIHYFQSYELLLDDLRDYRFYEEDLIHPNKVAIDYIWEKFAACFFNAQTKALVDDVLKISAMLQHRVFNSGTSTANTFYSKLSEAVISSPLDFSAEWQAWKKTNGF